MMKRIPPLLKKDFVRYGPALILGVALWALLSVLTGQVCSLVLFTGLPCPWCGMSRALLALVRLDLAASLQAHPLLLAYLALAVLFFLWRYGPLPRRILLGFGAVLLVLTLALYVFRMLSLFPHVSPMNYSSRNFLAWLQAIINKGVTP